MYVVVTGPPASGKSTLAPVLAAELGLPLLAKDTIKAGLVEELGADALDESHRLGRAAVRALLALAAQNGGGVLDSVWVDRERAITDLAALPGQVVEVFWNDGSLRPLDGPWPVIEVDTAGPVDRFAVLERVLVDADAAAQGLSLGVRPVGPIDIEADRALLVAFATRCARTLVRAGHVPDPFGVVLSLRGVPDLVAPGNWLSGPPGWTMGWGDLPPDELRWARDAVDRTSIRHRASALVSVDTEAGIVRAEARHRADDSVTRWDAAL
jgi:hypothetical protein